MSTNLQSLGVVARLFPGILNGDKTSTIRFRERAISPGYMLYICDSDPSLTVIVWVTGVTSMPLREAARYLARQDEWPDEIMLTGMREHYPAITLDDTVEIVEHLSPQLTRQRDDYPANRDPAT